MGRSTPRYWVVAKRTPDGTAFLTVRADGGAKVMPVFGFEDEAEMFVWMGWADDGWRVRETTAGELVSLLYGLRSSVESVVLDPPPGEIESARLCVSGFRRHRFVRFLARNQKRWSEAKKARPPRRARSSIWLGGPKAIRDAPALRRGSRV